MILDKLISNINNISSIDDETLLVLYQYLQLNRRARKQYFKKYIRIKREVLNRNLQQYIKYVNRRDEHVKVMKEPMSVLNNVVFTVVSDGVDAKILAVPLGRYNDKLTFRDVVISPF